ncbi:uncharacterized protein AMSG_03250 [Thecamonas trahens ATCC 50062]|uniref:Uncharacterized protein n=1 Tax=Thecamonas trahens ATCC 50062 TaxID=461836 RepID=A0A0L0D3D5_THETB|nr:hypothetical protein AMSG_03250 [Thecamonas trahens ATCC 50062]KNC46819.1 hypothetical protein AMSG_03250 [Thecamonas trahens ATCC 50062]|eukprot:XP_013760094.1 hypothetical protein AMSG_03250 [Thecamonas trahens ATCC 50062]
MPGLPSAWVRPHLLAMARPSWRKIADHGLDVALADAGVCVVVNLQQPGEHAFCGDGLDPHSSAGFAYDPDVLAAAGITHIASGWDDMGVPRMAVLARSVFFIDYAVNVLGGRAAVHCHAGLGRTGLVCAAYLVYSEHLSPQAAIAAVRAARPKAIQTRKQVAAVKRYARALADAAAVFVPSPALVELWRIDHATHCTTASESCTHWAHAAPKTPHTAAGVALPQPASLRDLLQRQELIVHGEERRELRYGPKAVLLLLRRLEAESRADAARALSDVAARVLPGTVRRTVADAGSWLWPEYSLQQSLNARLWHAVDEVPLVTVVSTLVSWLRFSLAHPLVEATSLNLGVYSPDCVGLAVHLMSAFDPILAACTPDEALAADKLLFWALAHGEAHVPLRLAALRQAIRDAAATKPKPVIVYTPRAGATEGLVSDLLFQAGATGPSSQAASSVAVNDSSISEPLSGSDSSDSGSDLPSPRSRSQAGTPIPHRPY